MRLARVTGRVVCSMQCGGLEGKRLLLLQPLDWESGEPKGSLLVAADAAGAGSRETVAWVASREASVAFPDLPPVDAAVVAIVDGRRAGGGS
jgi:microcompartment protein CcmK/EutM